MSESKLDKLYNLRFCRLQKQWKSKKTEDLLFIDNQETVKETSPTKQEKSLTSVLTEQGEDALKTSMGDNSTNNIEKFNELELPTAPNTVSRRLDLLMQLYKSTETISNCSEIKDDEQYHTPTIKLAEFRLDESENSADENSNKPIRLNILDERFELSELSKRLLSCDTDELGSSCYELDRFISFLGDEEEKKNLSFDCSFSMFMRGAHDVPHSTLDEVQFDAASHEELQFICLSELSSRQLSQGITRYVRAARVLSRELAVRSKLRELNSSNCQANLRLANDVIEMEDYSFVVNGMIKNSSIPDVFLSGSDIKV